MERQVRLGGEVLEEDLPTYRPTKHQRRLLPSEVEELIAARVAGAEINDLASRFGIHRATVINHLNQSNTPKRRRQGRTLTPDQLQRAGQAYASGLSLIEVGEQFDVDKRYLRRALPKAGFTIRPPGRSKKA